MDDLMNRYHPPVEEHRYSVKFVPVVDGNMSDDEIIKGVTFDAGYFVFLNNNVYH